MNYFQGSRLARMSDGTYCIVRDLGLVKGGKGLKHHENLLTLTAKGLASKLVQVLRHAPDVCNIAGAGKPWRVGRSFRARASE